MSKSSTKKTYLRLIKKTLEEISETPKSNPRRFEILKKKLAKYYEKVNFNNKN
jgi:hypothetical protein